MSAKKPAAKAKEKTSKNADTAIKRKPSAEAKEPTPVMDARSNQDRRQNDRRQHEVPVEVEHRVSERRVKASRRRQIDPTTCERDYSPEEVAFMTRLGRLQPPQRPNVPHVQRDSRSFQIAGL